MSLRREHVIKIIERSDPTSGIVSEGWKFEHQMRMMGMLIMSIDDLTLSLERMYADHKGLSTVSSFNAD